jgi:hypothetical protein
MDASEIIAELEAACERDAVLIQALGLELKKKTLKTLSCGQTCRRLFRTTLISGIS